MTNKAPNNQESNQISLFESQKDTFTQTICDSNSEIIEDKVFYGKHLINQQMGEFWTSKQRQASNLHEVSYRACLKPQLPRFFIEQYTKKKDIVYDPFGGRGTTVIEAALNGRNIIQNDINPLSTILAAGRLAAPTIKEISNRLELIKINRSLKSDIDLKMFYHKDTLQEIISFKEYFISREKYGKYDSTDAWLRMVATNRLTGHSRGFFSVYTLPPNQATSQEKQIKINAQRNQIPDYRDTKKLILKKSIQLLKNTSEEQRKSLHEIYKKSLFLNTDARKTKKIKSNSVSLVVTSPPFLNIVQYKADNWLRCWFNNINSEEIGKKITMSKKIEDWNDVMSAVLKELYRILIPGGTIAFEVGEIRNGKIRLDEAIAPLGIAVGLKCEKVIINSQSFTKTSNIWGVKNNNIGTNSNRIVVFKK